MEDWIMEKKRLYRMLAVAGALLASGCDESGLEQEPEKYVMTKAPLTAYCQITVQGYGTVEIESDYIPNTTWCENGNSPAQALRAQAVAARGFAYYKLNHNMGTSGNPVQNSQSDQVYKCEARAPSAEQFQKCLDAANDTNGLVLMYGDTVICTFYVSGTKGDCLDASCKDTGSCSHSNQKHVTYNAGKSGSGITQSSLGWISPSNKENRGCMSQNGATCLANNGYQWEDIIHFFYGDDAVPTKAVGACVQDKPKCETKITKSGTVIDDKDACFNRSTSSSWKETAAGYQDHLYATYAFGSSPDAVGTWTVNVERAGAYEVFAYITNIGNMSRSAPYTVRAGGKETEVRLNMAVADGWHSLGIFEFTKGGDQWVRLSDNSGEPDDANDRRSIVFDAIKFADPPKCEDVCAMEGGRECDGNGVKICRMGADGCLVWSDVASCAQNQTCTLGVCRNNPEPGGSSPGKPESCADECNVEKERQCDTDYSWHECGSFDEDICLEWSPKSVGCAPDEKCLNGACVAAGDLDCQHDCIADETRCEPDGLGFRSCGQYDDDACLDWSPVQLCGPGNACRDGECRPASETAHCSLEIDGRESVIIDELDPCFERSKGRWSELNDYGYDGHLYYTAVSSEKTAGETGTWRLNVTRTGAYDIEAFIETGIGAVAGELLYTVNAKGGRHVYKVDAARAQGWVKIGRFDLVEGSDAYVSLSDNSIVEGSAPTSYRVVFDAIRITPATNAPSDPGDDGSQSTVSVSADDSGCSAFPLNPKHPHAVWLGFAIGTAAFFGCQRRKKSRS